MVLFIYYLYSKQTLYKKFYTDKKNPWVGKAIYVYDTHKHRYTQSILHHFKYTYLQIHYLNYFTIYQNERQLEKQIYENKVNNG